jgi:hypothetical protein
LNRITLGTKNTQVEGIFSVDGTNVGVAFKLGKEIYKRGSVGLLTRKNLVTQRQKAFGIEPGTNIDLVFLISYTPLEDFLTPSNFKSYFDMGKDVYQDTYKLFRKANSLVRSL